MTEDTMFMVPTVSSPEAVALALLQSIMRVEGRRIANGAVNAADRKYLLDAYAECLTAVKNPSDRLR
jgi:hypothetical protein